MRNRDTIRLLEDTSDKDLYFECYRHLHQNSKYLTEEQNKELYNNPCYIDEMEAKAYLEQMQSALFIGCLSNAKKTDV